MNKCNGIAAWHETPRDSHQWTWARSCFHGSESLSRAVQDGILGSGAWPGTLNIQVSDQDENILHYGKTGIDTLDATDERREKSSNN